MYSQSDLSIRHEDQLVEDAILSLLLGAESSPVWTLGDVAREIGDEVTARDAVRRLEGSGVVHVAAGEVIFASRATQRLAELWDY